MAAAKTAKTAKTTRSRAGRPKETERRKALRRLTKAISEACEGMDEVKKGFVQSEFESYSWNCDRLDALEAKLTAEGLSPEERKDLRTERHQLVTESGQLFSHLMRQLKDVEPKAEADPIDEFLAGK